MKLVQEKSSVLAVIVNSAATRQEAKLNVKGKTIGQVTLRNGQQIGVKEGVATLPLEPFGVEILRLEKAQE